MTNNTETHPADGLQSRATEMPLVSVGIPVYNRASLLDARIANVLGQTHRNIQVIISDNASTNREMQAVIGKWAAADSRVQAHLQPENLGSYRNFLFVMNQARGPYFVWAADDDDWDEDFIETCLRGIGAAQLFMPDMATHFMATGQIDPIPVPSLSLTATTYQNAVCFLRNMQPGLIYGLHEMGGLKAVMPVDAFDLSDVFTVYAAVLEQGVITGSGSQYRAGVVDAVYQIKPFGRAGSTDKLSYRRFLIRSFQVMAASRKLGPAEKARLALLTLSATLATLKHLTQTYPHVARPHHLVLTWLLSTPDAVAKSLRRTGIRNWFRR